MVCSNFLIEQQDDSSVAQRGQTIVSHRCVYNYPAESLHGSNNMLNLDTSSSSQHSNRSSSTMRRPSSSLSSGIIAFPSSSVHVKKQSHSNGHHQEVQVSRKSLTGSSTTMSSSSSSWGGLPSSSIVLPICCLSSTTTNHGSHYSLRWSYVWMFLLLGLGFCLLDVVYIIKWMHQHEERRSVMTTTAEMVTLPSSLSSLGGSIVSIITKTTTTTTTSKVTTISTGTDQQEEQPGKDNNNVPEPPQQDQQQQQSLKSLDAQQETVGWNGPETESTAREETGDLMQGEDQHVEEGWDKTPDNGASPIGKTVDDDGTVNENNSNKEEVLSNGSEEQEEETKGNSNVEQHEEGEQQQTDPALEDQPKQEEQTDDQTAELKYEGKEQLVQLLIEAGVDMDQSIIDRLPYWSQVAALYGDKPRMYGLDSCKRFQKLNDPGDHLVTVAGNFNSGTNLLAELLIHNCHLPKRMAKYGPYQRGVRWQALWGKHTPVDNEQVRLQHHAYEGKNNETLNAEDFFPAVTIRDPFKWMQSMCRHHYTARWRHSMRHCPNLIPSDLDLDLFPDLEGETTVPVHVRYRAFNRSHDSLVGFWNDWYNAYLNAPFPRLLVRFEDVIYHPKEVTSAVCKCAGGELNKHPFVFVVDSAKRGLIHGNHKTNYIDAMIRYGTEVGRYQGYTKDDLAYAKDNLDHRLMQLFGYHYPPTSKIEQFSQSRSALKS